jgi:hypothetical protein
MLNLSAKQSMAAIGHQSLDKPCSAAVRLVARYLRVSGVGVLFPIAFVIPGQAEQQTPVPIAANTNVSDSRAVESRQQVLSADNSAVQKNEPPAIRPPGSGDTSPNSQTRSTTSNPYASFLVNLDQATSWATNRSGISNTWLNMGLAGALGKDTLFTWSVTGGPTFQGGSAPNVDATNWRFDVFTALSPLKGNEINIYATMRTIGGASTNGPLRTLNAGIVASLARSEIIPDVIESINLPERGIYVRAANRSSWSGTGSYSTSYTDLYAGWAETWYPFSFAIETGPQLVQTYPGGQSTPLRTYWGATFNVTYILSAKSQMFLEYRPSTSFRNQSGGATQLLRAGVGYKF